MASGDVGIGATVGHYRLEALLGRGGMGVVYLAKDLRLGRHVAVKLLARDLAEDEVLVGRFLRESRLAASIDHPNIIPVYEAGEDKGSLFIAMRYVDGSDLKDLLLRDGRLPVDRTVLLLRQTASGLDVAHNHNLVHRDLKPGNILVAAGVDGDHAYLCDFGLSRQLDVAESMTGTRGLLGTIDYMAPEQLNGGPVDARADIYALGCVLYQCLSGTSPFAVARSPYCSHIYRNHRRLCLRSWAWPHLTPSSLVLWRRIQSIAIKAVVSSPKQPRSQQMPNPSLHVTVGMSVPSVIGFRRATLAMSSPG